MSHKNTKIISLNGWHPGFSLGLSFINPKNNAKDDVIRLFDFIFENIENKGLLKLLQKKNINAIDKAGNSILHFVNQYFRHKYSEEAHKAKAALKYLIANNLINLNLQNFSGENVFHSIGSDALEYLGPEIMQKMITPQNINAPDNNGESPIFKSINKPLVFNFLLTHGANLLHADNALNTIAHKNINAIIGAHYIEDLDLAVEILNLYSFSEYKPLFLQKNKENITPLQLIEKELLNPKSRLNDDTKVLLSSIKTKIMITNAFDLIELKAPSLDARCATSKNKI